MDTAKWKKLICWPIKTPDTYSRAKKVGQIKNYYILVVFSSQMTGQEIN